MPARLQRAATAGALLAVLLSAHTVRATEGEVLEAFEFTATDLAPPPSLLATLTEGLAVAVDSEFAASRGKPPAKLPPASPEGVALAFDFEFAATDQSPTPEPTPRSPVRVTQAFDFDFEEFETPEPEAAPSAEFVEAPEVIEPLGSPSATQEPSPTTEKGSALSRPMAALTIDGAPEGDLAQAIAGLEGDFAIVDMSAEEFGSWRAPVAEAAYAPPRFAPVAFHWAAPAVFSRPLYFEQPNVERYGHYVGWCDHDVLTQSTISAAHFFATVPALPYLMGAEPQHECNYVLGSFRPGSCNPHQLVKPVMSLRGLVYEGVVATGLVYLIP